MGKELTQSNFSEYLGETFRVGLEEVEPVEMVLTEVSPLNYPNPSNPSGREPFSVVLRGPGDRPLTQRIYQIEHEGMGSFELFIVPIGPDGEGLCYEAVFN